MHGCKEAGGVHMTLSARAHTQVLECYNSMGDDNPFTDFAQERVRHDAASGAWILRPLDHPKPAAAAAAASSSGPATHSSPPDAAASAAGNAARSGADDIAGARVLSTDSAAGGGVRGGGGEGSGAAARAVGDASGGCVQGVVGDSGEAAGGGADAEEDDDWDLDWDTLEALERAALAKSSSAGVVRGAGLSV